MVECRNFRMWNMSLSQLFGKTPKIEWICGRCDSYNESRLLVKAVQCGRPYARCECCDETNYIPIHYNYGDEKEDDEWW